jgi:hypothetical protein
MESKVRTLKQNLTSTSITTFQTCPRKYYWGYVEKLEPIREKALPLRFGTLWHTGMEIWHRDKDLSLVHKAMETSTLPPIENMQLLAMMGGYVEKYPIEDFIVLELEKQFEAKIRNPKTNRLSRKFSMRGKVDGIVEKPDGNYVLEHKTTSVFSGTYLERLWADFQVMLYCYYLYLSGYSIVGVIYNIAQKPGIRLKKTETLEEYGERLIEVYKNPDMFHREELVFDFKDFRRLVTDVWDVLQNILWCEKNDTWAHNTGSCFKWNSSCAFYPICKSNDNPLVIENDYKVREDVNPELKEEEDVT